jgi:phage gp29-like protein
MNRWREYYNPLEHLSMRRVSALLHASQLGFWADLQWTYKFIEERDATLLALVERRAGALLQLDYDCLACAPDRLPPGATSAEAEEQASALRGAYERIENLREAVEFLALASFRGFSHLEKIRDETGAVVRLDPVEQWHWTRKSLYSPWLYNAPALQTNEGTRVELSRFVIREVGRPIDPVGLVTYVRKGLSQKNWDAFVEIYGIPGAIVFGPPEMPKEMEAEYRSSAESISMGGSGFLPYGSDVKFSVNTGEGRPFQEHLRNLDEHLVLAGTGGLLTMLAESGAGTLAGSAHQKAFDLIARAEARKISEVFQRQFDQAILEAQFPGRPHLAHFELVGDNDPESGDVVDHVLKLSQAGFEADPAQITEKTGYRVKAAGRPASEASSSFAGGKITG